MIRLVRINTPALVERIRGRLIDDDFNDDSLIESVKIGLANDPNGLFLVYGLSGDELIGFILAIDMDNQPHVFIQQAWAKHTCPTSVTAKVFRALQLWTLSLGKNEIRTETQRDVDVFERKYKFKTYSRIITHKIPEEVKNEIF